MNYITTEKEKIKYCFNKFYTVINDINASWSEIKENFRIMEAIMVLDGFLPKDVKTYYEENRKIVTIDGKFLFWKNKYTEPENFYCWLYYRTLEYFEDRVNKFFKEEI